MTDAASLRDVTLVLSGRTVLSDVTLSLRAGEFVGLLGPNGAGKTTLMRALLGLVAPAAGRIEIAGGLARPGRAGIGYMPQSRAPSGSALGLCGEDFVAAAAAGRRWGLPRPSRAERDDIAACIVAVGAERIARRPLAELSGGERQRLLLAVALLGRPMLLLLDEPLVSLDPPSQSAIVGLIRDLQRARGLTVLCAAHELNPLLPALDRVLYLARGRAAIGPAASVLTSDSLSRLYGAPIEVARTAGGRVFVGEAA